MGLQTQMPTVPGVLIAGAILLMCGIGVVLMVRSRRPDPKMTFLMDLLNAAADVGTRPGGRRSEVSEPD